MKKTDLFRLFCALLLFSCRFGAIWKRFYRVSVSLLSSPYTFPGHIPNTQRSRSNYFIFNVFSTFQFEHRSLKDESQASEATDHSAVWWQRCSFSSEKSLNIAFLSSDLFCERSNQPRASNSPTWCCLRVRESRAWNTKILSLIPFTSCMLIWFNIFNKSIYVPYFLFFQNSVVTESPPGERQ